MSSASTSSLQRRLAITLSAIVAVVVIVLLMFNFLLANSVLDRAVDDRLRDQAALLENRPGGTRPPDLRDLAGNDRRGDRDTFADRTFRLAVVTAGNEQFGADVPIPQQLLDDIRADGRDKFRTMKIDGDEFRVLTRLTPQGDVVLLAQEIGSTDSAVRRLGQRLVIAGLLGVLAAGLLGWLIARQVTSPITRVAAAARQLAHAQDLPSRIEVNRTDEVGQLATSFNQMLTALEVSREQQTRLVADASHELRTPLTSLRVKIDFLQSEPDLPAENRASIVEGAALELQSLTELVTELVDLASNSSIDEQPVHLNLGDVVEDVANRSAVTSGRKITVQRSGHAVVARPRMVRRAVSNLVDNAIKYSPDGTRIEVIEAAGRIEVVDHGPGIDVADREFAFDRFFRADGAQSKPGSGIGLAIVKRAAVVHNGDVWINDTPGGGATIGFSIGTDPSAEAATSAPPNRRD